MRNRVRFALAGFGAWGRFHAQSIAGNPDAELLAIAVPSERSRREAESLYPAARIFADPQTMIVEVDFDIIDVCTPSHTHRAIAVAAIQKGRHLLLEKPMAIRSRTAGPSSSSRKSASGTSPSATSCGSPRSGAKSNASLIAEKSGSRSTCWLSFAETLPAGRVGLALRSASASAAGCWRSRSTFSISHAGT